MLFPFLFPCFTNTWETIIVNATQDVRIFLVQICYKKRKLQKYCNKWSYSWFYLFPFWISCFPSLIGPFPFNHSSWIQYSHIYFYLNDSKPLNGKSWSSDPLLFILSRSLFLSILSLLMPQTSEISDYIILFSSCKFIHNLIRLGCIYNYNFMKPQTFIY